VVEAARSVFAEKGLCASVEVIAERADVAHGSVYYHFETKEGLIRQVIEKILVELTETMEAECAGREGLELVLDGIIQSHITFFSNRWEDFVVYYQGRAELTLEESLDGLEKPFVTYARSIEALIDACIPEPISEARLRRVANAIAGFVAGYYSLASVASVDQDIDKEFANLRQALVASLAKFTKEALPC
jgi:AcrR family transcriptional regulator